MSDNGNGEKNGVGRPKKYLTVDKFNEFLHNDFKHLNRKVNAQFALLLAIFGASIAKLFLG